MSDSAFSVRYRGLRYQAQSDITDHGYRTKCPPMIVCHVNHRGVICPAFFSYGSALSYTKIALITLNTKTEIYRSFRKPYITPLPPLQTVFFRLLWYSNFSPSHFLFVFTFAPFALISLLLPNFFFLAFPISFIFFPSFPFFFFPFSYFSLKWCQQISLPGGEEHILQWIPPCNNMEDFS